MNALFSFWYVQSAGWALASFQSSIRALEGKIGVRDMLRNLRQPLFQDYTLQGRAIGLVIRLARAGLGGLTYVGVAVVYVFGYLVWLLFPFLCLTSILGSLVGPLPI